MNKRRYGRHRGNKTCSVCLFYPGSLEREEMGGGGGGESGGMAFKLQRRKTCILVSCHSFFLLAVRFFVWALCAL